MDKQALLKVIATSGYNIGFGAKKHFATLDIVEKMPGWIGLIALAAGVLSLFIPELETKYISASFTILGIAALTFNTYSENKEKYAKAGGELTSKFHELRVLYETVKSQSDSADMAIFLAEHNEIQKQALQFSMSKHIFLSDWYAHAKFFGQNQVDWMNEQLHFQFIKDKLPFSAKVLIVAVSLAIIFSYLPNVMVFLNHFVGSSK